MKLSEKGFYKVLRTCRFDEDRATYSLKFSDANKDYFFEVQGTEFEPDDFQGVVCLSVEEACEILDYLGYLHLSGGRDSFLKGLEKCNQNLYERIEQTEVQDEIK